MATPYAEVIGDPIAHSKSPLIHLHWLRKFGIKGDYRAVRVAADELSDYLDSRRADPYWRGCNVTRPLKELIVPSLDTTGPAVSAIGAVNTVVRDAGGRLDGRNTDVHGLLSALDGLVAEGGRIVLVGAGGAARAAAFAVKAFRPTELTILARRLDRGRRILADLELEGEVAALGSIPETDLLVNASPRSGPWDLSGLGPGTVVLDMVYDPVETLLLKTARERGMTAVDGLAMLAHQASEAFGAFFPEAPPAEPDAYLTRQLAR